MSSQEKKSKKRKSTAAHDTGSSVSVILPESSVGVGPAFVNFPSVKPNKRVPFTIYSRDEAASSHDITAQKTLIAGETEDVEFFSTNRDVHVSDEGGDCKYVAAVYDPSTKQLHIHPTTPLYLLAHRVKRLKQAPVSAAPGSKMWKEQRNDLGETFGTRKAKSQIKAEERNKVDVNAMQGVRADLMESIGGKEETSDLVAPPELIPTPNLTTNNPHEVYPRESIIPSNEWSSLDVAPIVKAKDDKARVMCLPYKRSRWIENKLRVAVEGPSSARKDRLRMLYYLSCLMSFFNFANALQRTSVSDLPEKLAGIPQQVLNGLLARFAEPLGKKYQVTDKCRAKLLIWIAVCYLAADEWTVDVGKVAKDLSMEPRKIVDLYKQLGCTVDLPSPAEREKLGLSLAEAQKHRRAQLKAPVKFPKVKRRGPVKR